jgi:hypothetical protein
MAQVEELKWFTLVQHTRAQVFSFLSQFLFSPLSLDYPVETVLLNLSLYDPPTHTATLDVWECDVC